MSFHCSDRAEYVRSGRKLNDETLQTLAEYFKSIFLAQFGNGSIQWKHDDRRCKARALPRAGGALQAQAQEASGKSGLLL